MFTLLELLNMKLNAADKDDEHQVSLMYEAIFTVGSPETVASFIARMLKHYPEYSILDFFDDTNLYDATSEDLIICTCNYKGEQDGKPGDWIMYDNFAKNLPKFKTKEHSRSTFNA